MRFMMIVKATKESEAGILPSEKLLAAMGKYNEELAKAGVLLDLSGLQSSSKGVRVKFSNGKRTVLDGPFTETKELIAGYWIIQVKSQAEAIEWASAFLSTPVSSPAAKPRSKSANSSNLKTSLPATLSIAPANWAKISRKKSDAHVSSIVDFRAPGSS